MALAHLTVAGVVESSLTAGVVAYLQRANLPVLRINHADVAATDDELAAARRLGLAVGARRARRRWRCSRRSACSRPAARSARTRPTTSTSASTTSTPCRPGCDSYAGFWHHALFDGYDFTRRQHPTIGYLVSAVVGIGVDRAGRVLVGSSQRCSVGRVARHDRGDVERGDRVTRRAATDEHRARRLAARSPRSGCARAAASASARRAASSRRRSTARRDLMRQAMFSEDMAAQPGCCSGSTRG